MAVAVLYLLGRRERRGDQLQAMDPGDHRNTLVVAVANDEMIRRDKKQGWPPLRSAVNYERASKHSSEL